MPLTSSDPRGVELALAACLTCFGDNVCIFSRVLAIVSNTCDRYVKTVTKYTPKDTTIYESRSSAVVQKVYQTGVN